MIAALGELYMNAEFAVCRNCMTKEEKDRALSVIVQKLVEYYASQGLDATIRTSLDEPTFEIPPGRKAN